MLPSLRPALAGIACRPGSSLPNPPQKRLGAYQPPASLFIAAGFMLLADWAGAELVLSAQPAVSKVAKVPAKVTNRRNAADAFFMAT
jgi:hypothetical protein